MSRKQAVSLSRVAWLGWVGLSVAAVLWLGSRAAPAKDDEMTLPAALLELVKTTKMGGEVALEVDASGRVVAIEAEVAVESLPKAAIDLASKLLPGAKPVAGEKEWISGQTYWEVVLDNAGSRVELLVKEDGTEGGREVVVPAADVPKAVLEAADKAVAGGRVEVVEKVVGAEAGGRGTEFHVKKNVDGETQRISVSPDGKVPLVLRKIKAEVKLPR
jgi:uncharacterized protein YuzE